MWWKRRPKRIYLDYAAASPVRAEVLDAMQPYWQSHFANASAIHKEGQVARQAIDEARLRVARLLGIRPNGVVFTGSGTESNSLAIHGSLQALIEKGQALADCEIITTKIQHPSVLETVAYLASQGVTVKYCPVDEEGRVDKQAFQSLLSEKTTLVTLAYVNSEVGTIENVRTLSRLIQDFNRTHHTNILFHIDAAQAPLWLSCRLETVGADLLSIDAGKFYGPKGVGILAFQHKVQLKGMLLGGGQEFGLRASTENVAGIVGAAAALELAQTTYQDRSERVQPLRDQLIGSLSSLEGVLVNGPLDDRVANNVNISVPGLDSEFLVVSLDAAGIAASTRSACSSAHGSGSYVVREMTGDDARATSTVRLTLGEETTNAEINTVIKILTKIIKEQQAFAATVHKK